MQNLFRRLLFDYWYFRQPPWDTGVSPPELLAFIQEHNPGRAIDIGCGTGTNVITLASAGWKVTGVDFAPRAVNIAREKIKKAGIQAEVFVRDATKLEGATGCSTLLLISVVFTPFHRTERQNTWIGLTGSLRPMASGCSMVFSSQIRFERAPGWPGRILP